MSIKRLSLEGAQNLISKYKADMNVLDFQLTEMKSVLKELEAHHSKKKKVADKIAAAKAKKANAKKAAAAKKAAKKAAARAKKAKAKSKAKAPKAAAKRGRKPGRPAAKKAAPKKATAKRGRKPGRPAAKKAAPRKSKGGARGRKMSYSDWDMLVMNSLKGGSSPVRTSVLLNNGTRLAKKLGGKSDEKFVRAKVAASLQKLVNKTKEVKKVPAEGRGFAYAMR